MLDPLTALGLVSNVIQLVDLGRRVLVDSVELYRSSEGTSSTNLELERLISDFRDITEGLSVKASPPVTDAEKKLENLAKDCEQFAKNFLSVLVKLRVDVQNGRSKIASIKQAVKTMWRADQIRDYQFKLTYYRGELLLHLNVVIRNQQEALTQSLDHIAARVEQWGIQNTNTVIKTEDTILKVLESAQENARLTSDLERILQSGNSSVKQMLEVTLERHGSRFEQLGIKLEEQIEEIQQKVVKGIYSIDEHIVAQLNSGLLELKKTQEQAQPLSSKIKVLESLLFPTIRAREIAVRQAHRKTFEWIFSDQSNRKIGFLDWLRSGEGLYWVSGAPGTGKSTLMKFLTSKFETREALQQWAGEKTIIIASYFFWNSGTPMQKSQQGLFQSLLFDVLKENLDLVSTVCPRRYQADPARTPEPWSLAELYQVFQEIDLQSKSRYCFFIDGLDEYDGDPSDAIEFVRDLSALKSVKLCVASRPWNTFEYFFGMMDCPTLLLEELTRSDIYRYVQDNLVDNTTCSHLQNQPEFQDLIGEIIHRAQGVFLWVHLVVKSLQRGALNGDTIEDYQRRLRLLPTDLKKYFQHMLENVDEVYHEEAARIFLLCLAATQPLSVLTLSFFDEKSLYPVLQHGKRMSDFSTRYSVVINRIKEGRKRIQARCQDLLTIPSLSMIALDERLGITVGSEYTSTPDAEASVRNCVRELRVNFLHRTVRDFFRTKEMERMLHERVGSEFVAHIHLCKALVAHRSLVSLLKPMGDDISEVSFYRSCLNRAESATFLTPTQFLYDMRTDIRRLGLPPFAANESSIEDQRKLSDVFGDLNLTSTETNSVRRLGTFHGDSDPHFRAAMPRKYGLRNSSPTVEPWVGQKMEDDEEDSEEDRAFHELWRSSEAEQDFPVMVEETNADINPLPTDWTEMSDFQIYPYDRLDIADHHFAPMEATDESHPSGLRPSQKPYMISGSKRTASSSRDEILNGLDDGVLSRNVPATNRTMTDYVLRTQEYGTIYDAPIESTEESTEHFAWLHQGYTDQPRQRSSNRFLPPTDNAEGLDWNAIMFPPD